MRQVCRNVVTLTPLRQVPIGAPEAEPQGNAMSVRITAAGAVAVALLAFHTAPVSACDERYVKKCERESAAAAVGSEEPATAPAAKRRAGRVQAIVSHRGKRVRFVQRTHAPRFTKHERGMTLASAESRMTTLPDTPLARRFRGFINPQPLAQNAFEALRKPHIVADNLEPPAAAPADASATAAEEAAKPATMELTSAESKAVTLPELPAAAAKPVALASATVTPTTAPPLAAPQPIVTEAPPPAPNAPTGFPIHSLVLALCGALGAAGALRFIVGA
jgi:hypothetical protein